MKFFFSETIEKSDVVVIPFWEGPEAATSSQQFTETIHTPLLKKDFKGKKGETLFLYEKNDRICLLGLGKKHDPENLRRAYAEVVKASQAKKVEKMTLLAPQCDLKAVAEGVLLSNYSFTKLRGISKDKSPVLIQEIHWIGAKESQKEINRIKTIVESVNFVRDLVNGNADDVTPQFLAETALALPSPIEVKVLDKKRLEEEKMGLILAVSRASSYDPFLIEVSYRGNPSSKDHVVLVGKGITYDTGGLAIKTMEGMTLMKCDMAGGAAVMGAVKAAAELRLKVNVTAVIPAVENAIGSKSYKLGDVYKSASGKTVEIISTDAEGRLVLADGLTYAQKHLHPTCMIDLGSLTGAIIVGLGEEIAGLFTKDETLSSDLMSASRDTAELLWPMPLHQDYADSLQSDIADLLNVGGREGASIKAALFLKEFAGSIPWAHLDIAGPVYWVKPRRYHPTKATGYGVRLLVDFLTKRSSS